MFTGYGCIGPIWLFAFSFYKNNYKVVKYSSGWGARVKYWNWWGDWNFLLIISTGADGGGLGKRFERKKVRINIKSNLFPLEPFSLYLFSQILHLAIYCVWKPPSHPCVTVCRVSPIITSWPSNKMLVIFRAKIKIWLIKAEVFYCPYL